MKSPLKTDGNGRHPSPRRVFVPTDFGAIIRRIPETCPLVGGQAVAWWASFYSISGSFEKPLTSCDIDFWGFREDLQRLATAMRRKPVWPHKYEMTAWVGGIPLLVNGEETIVDFINSVPGLDVIDPEKASVGQIFRTEDASKKFLVLSPVSLVLSKLHALRAYDQADRQDELHLKVSLLTSMPFIAQLLDQSNIREALWNVERLIAASRTKPYQRLESKHRFRILSAVPIPQIRAAASGTTITPEDRHRLKQFITKRWTQVGSNAG